MAAETDAMTREERIKDYVDRLTGELIDRKESIDPVSAKEDAGVHAYDTGLRGGLDMAISVVSRVADESDMDMLPVEFSDQLSDALVERINRVDVPETRGRTQSDEVKYERRCGVKEGLRLANEAAIDTPLLEDM